MFRTFAIVLTLAVLIPSAVKLTHAFNHHEHVVCTDDYNHSTHFHQSDLDCDFYKFKQTNNFFFVFSNYGNIDNAQNYHHQFTYYSFLNSHQQLTSYLRGPPQLV